MNNRPLSPHLQVYRPQLTSMLSILHRITGFGLAAGLILALWWLGSIALGAEAYSVFYAFCTSMIGRVFLFGWLFALVYHLLNGIRHLFWDACVGLELKTTYQSGWAVFLGAIVVTVLLWMRG